VIACIYTEYADTASVLEENKQRRVPIAAETLTQLQSYITDNSIPAEAPLFSITQQWIRMLINKYARLIGKNIHPHTFRHSFAINSVRHGVALRRLQQSWGIRTSIQQQSTCSLMTGTCRMCMRTCHFK